jgi:hypothetical protein
VTNALKRIWAERLISGRASAVLLTGRPRLQRRIEVAAVSRVELRECTQLSDRFAAF